MNAAITTVPPATTDADTTPATSSDLPATTQHTSPELERTGPADAPSFGACQARSMTLSVLLVFVGAAITHYATQGNALDAIGLGAFLAFWIGGGFGFLIGGVIWGLGQEEH